MSRWHLAELEDQPWFPANIRNCMTDLLNYLITLFRIYDPIVPVLYKAMRLSSSQQILDLCSGGGGAVCRVQNLLKKKYNFRVSLMLSDLYPNKHACMRLQELKDSKISYLSQAIDATQVPKSLTGFRTLFTCFHHFDPKSAHKILSDAVKHDQGIAIFELSERSLRGAIGPLAAVLLAFLATPFVRPFSWQRLFFTYIMPVIPLAFLFDGIISQLRSYTHEEMLELAKKINNKNFTWEAGFARHKLLPFRLNYLIGYKSGDNAS